MECPSSGVRTAMTIVDSKGDSEAECRMGKAKRPKRPNKPNGHCSLHLAPQALHIKCPSVGVRTMSTIVDSKGDNKEECRVPP